jgi:hypothetical protein
LVWAVRLARDAQATLCGGAEMVIPSPEMRATTVAALHKALAGVPTLERHEAYAVASRRLTSRDLRFAAIASDDDLALVSACLAVEEQIRADQFTALDTASRALSVRSRRS